jgi:hypothetical protein
MFTAPYPVVVFPPSLNALYMAVKLLTLRMGRPLPPERFLLLISFRGLVEPRAVVRLEGLGQLRNPVTSPENEPTTSRLVA